ncbi:MAG: UbiD family decarboxylase [Moorellales bacterium]
MSDLRSFLAEVRRRTPNEYFEVEKEIDPKYEIAALHKQLEKLNRYPVLYFKRVKGSSLPVVLNVYGHRDRLALALNTTPDKVTEVYSQREDHPIPPREVQSAPVQEVVITGAEVDLFQLPVLTAHEPDIAPYLTTGIVIAKDPDTGVHNASFGRLMLVDRNTVYTHVTPGRHLHQYYTKAESRGQSLPVTISLGSPPTWALGALSLIPIDQDELAVMGAMDGQPLKIVPGKTVPVPALAEAEIVLEGEILPRVRGEEGPFCEFTGYATGRRQRHVVKITAITMRRDPVYHALIAGSTEHRVLGSIARESYLLKAARVAAPSVKAVHVPVSGCGRFHCYVSLEKRAKGQPLNVGMAVLGADVYTKMVIVVDHDIDVFDEREVLWAVATRVQGNRDITFIPRALGSDLDPSADEDGVVCKTIVDATAKPFLDQYHARAVVPQEVMERIRLEDYLPGLVR